MKRSATERPLAMTKMIEPASSVGNGLEVAGQAPFEATTARSLVERVRAHSGALYDEASGSPAARVSLLVRIETSKACNTPFRFCGLFREAVNSSSERATPYSCPGGAAALTPPVRRPIASADLVNFAGSGSISVATTLAKRFCTGSGVSSTTAALGLPG